MPNRIVREGCLDSERVDALSEQAENFYKRLWNVVDDYGRFEVDPVVLLSRTYPRRVNRYTPEMVDAWLAECSQGTVPLITIYRDGRKKYLQVNDFRQRVRTPSKCPPPPGTVDPEPSGRQMTDIRPSSAGLARAASRDATDTTTNTTTAPATHSQEGGVGKPTARLLGLWHVTSRQSYTNFIPSHVQQAPRERPPKRRLRNIPTHRRLGPKPPGVITQRIASSGLQSENASRAPTCRRCTSGSAMGCTCNRVRAERRRQVVQARNWKRNWPN